MYERLQILVTAEQRRRLDETSKATGRPVTALVREAIDKQFGEVSREQRLEAYERLKKRRIPFIPIDELNRLIETRYDDILPKNV